MNVGLAGPANAVTISPTSNQVAIVGSDSGGLFKTTDGGVTWSHIDSFVPNRVWDVLYDPTNANRLIATAVVDTHQPTMNGIWRSTDGGNTWSKPATADSTDPACTAEHWGRDIDIVQWSGDPTTTAYVGTSCGLAVGTDAGATWTHIDLPGSGREVMDIDAHHSGIVDACAEDGPHRSVSKGAAGTWTAPPFDRGYAYYYPIGHCTIAASPFEPDVLLASQSFPGHLWESDNGGDTWTILMTYGSNRPTFVKTQPAIDGHSTHFDVFFGSDDTWRQHCHTGGPGLRCALANDSNCANALDDDDGDTFGMVNDGCPAVGGSEMNAVSPPGIACKNAVDDDGDGWVNDGCPTPEFYAVNAHHDPSDIAFDTSGGTNYPLLITSDGGMSRSPDGGLTWPGSNTGMESLQIHDMAGTSLPDHADLYFSTMDNWLWASPAGGLSWSAPPASVPEGFFIQAPQSASGHGQTVGFTYCYPCSNLRSTDHFATVSGWASLPPNGFWPQLIEPGVWIEWADAGGGVYNLYLTTNDGASWAQVPGATLSGLPYSQAGGIAAITGPPSNPVIFQPVQKPGRLGLVKITGIRTGSATVSDADSGLSDLGTYFVSPFLTALVSFDASPDGNTLIAADTGTNQMKISTNGGSSWSVSTQLTGLVTNSGSLLFEAPLIGLQSHAIGFHPTFPNWVLVGTDAGGVLASFDRGATWSKVAGSEQINNVSSFFFDQPRDIVYISSYGRGIWKWDASSVCSDGDDDGICTPADNCPTVANPGQENTDGDPWGNACDGCPSMVTAWATPLDDDDCDAFPSSTYDPVTKRAAESFMGTLPNARCAATTTPNDEDPDPWPMDNNDDRKANLGDILGYIPVFGTTGPGLPYKARYDLNQDNKVGLSDILMFIPFFGITCTP